MAGLKIRRLGYALGAEVTGFDGAQPLGSDLVAELHKAIVENVMVCMPGQNLDAAQMAAFCSQLGELYRDVPRNRHPDHNDITVIANKPISIGGTKTGGYNVADQWHADRTFTTQPTSFTCLLAKQLPEIGGNTMFCNMAMAYDTLSPAFARMIEGLEAVHDATLGTTFALNPELRDEIRKASPPVVQPLVKTHPDTGKKALCLGYRIRNFVGMTEEESKPIVAFLTQHATRYEFIYRHVWSLNDLVIWDNRSAMHYAVPDYDRTQIRTLLRCAVNGPKLGRYYEGEQSVPASVPAEKVAIKSSMN